MIQHGAPSSEQLHEELVRLEGPPFCLVSEELIGTVARTPEHACVARLLSRHCDLDDAYIGRLLGY